MVGRAVLEPVAGDELERVGEITEPEPSRIEQVRAEIGQHARSLVAPRRVAHQSRGAVAVEHTAAEDAPELPRGDEVAHPDEMGLEAVIVGGIADRAIVVRQPLQTEDVVIRRGEQRLLDEHVLAVREQPCQHLDFGLVRNAGERRVVIVQRHVLDSTVACLAVHRVDAAGEVVAGDAAALRALHSHPYHRHAHRPANRRNARASPAS